LFNMTTIVITLSAMRVTVTVKQKIFYCVSLAFKVLSFGHPSDEPL
jgi:hypothetical protein